MSTKKKFATAVVLAVIAIAAFFFLRGGEPPMDFGNPGAGGLGRSTKLVTMSQESRVYDIEYPARGLSSRATVSFMSGALREEVFPKRWRVVYEYNERFHEHLGIPASFTIYGYSYFSGQYDRFITRYTLTATQPNLMHYTSTSGRTKDISTTYFRVAESMMDSMRRF